MELLASSFVFSSISFSQPQPQGLLQSDTLSLRKKCFLTQNSELSLNLILFSLSLKVPFLAFNNRHINT